MLDRDTHPPVAAVQRAAWARLGPDGRLKLALEMSDFVRELAVAGLRQRHPDWTERDLLRELARLTSVPDPIAAPPP